MLSRCLEEGATLSTSLIPWTTSGAFITGVLGMSPLEFAPWAFFNYINPLLSIGLAYMGFGIFRQQGFEPLRETPLSSLKNE
jgi:NhaC family Na+:H+ antiporter